MRSTSILESFPQLGTSSSEMLGSPVAGKTEKAEAVALEVLANHGSIGAELSSHQWEHLEESVEDPEIDSSQESAESQETGVAQQEMSEGDPNSESQQKFFEELLEVAHSEKLN